MSSGAGPSQGQSACGFPTAHVRIIPSPFDLSPFNRGRKKVHVAFSFRIYWRKATDDVNKQPRSLLDFGNAYSLQIERLESNASRNDVERIVKAVALSDGKPSLIVSGYVDVLTGRGLVKKKVKIELTPETLQERDAWLEHIRMCAMPWSLIRLEIRQVHSIMQQNASIEELRKQIQGIVIGVESSDLVRDPAVPDNPAEEVHEVVTATSRPFSSPRGVSNETVTKMLGGIPERLQKLDKMLGGIPERLQKLDWADKFNIHVNAVIGIGTTGVIMANKSKQAAPKMGVSEEVTQVAETAQFVADVSNGVAGVSTAFQLLALSARMLARFAEANRGVLILPGLLDRAIFLLNRQLQSFGFILDVTANIEKFYEDFSFEVLQQTIDVMVLIETQLLRGSGRRFLKALVAKEIITKIKELTEDVIITSLMKGSDDQSLEPVHEMHHSRPELSRYFVGRRKELNELKLILRKHGSAAIAQYGGVGKTELMIALAQRAELEDEVAGGVFWLTVDGGLESVVESLAHFVGKLRGLEMTKEDRKDQVLVVAQLKECLSRRTGRWLICLDSADNEEISPVLGAVCAIAASSEEKGWVVVTSRLGLPRLWKEMKKEQKVNLQPLSAEDAMILLWRLVEVNEAEEEDDKTVRGKLSKFEEKNSSEYDALVDLCGDDNPYSLGGLPLALVQAGMYIGRFECSFGEYVELLKETNGKTELNEIFRKVREQYLVKDEKRSILTTWKLNVDRLSDKANDVLRSMSMLGPFPIPEPVVTGIVKRLADEGESTERMMRDVIMEELVHGSSLVYLKEKDRRETFNIHRLVQRFVLADVERGSELWNKSYGNAFLSLRSRIEVMLSIDGNSVDSLSAVFGDQYCLYLPHLFAIIDNYVLPHSAANRVIPASELYDLARFTNELSEFLGDQNAVNMWQSVLEALQWNHGTNRASTLIKSELANSKHFLGCALEKQGELCAAESVYDESLRMLREIHGQHVSHPNIAALLNSIGCLYEEQGKFVDAESVYDESLRMWGEIHGQDASHPNIAKVLYNLRRLYEKLEEVESMDGEIPEKRRDIWGNEYSLGLPPSIESCTEASVGFQSIESEPFIGDRPEIKAMDSTSKMKEDPILTRPPIGIADIGQDSKESSSLSLPYIELGNTQVVDRKQLYVQSTKYVHDFQDLFLLIPKALLAHNVSLVDETLPYDDAFVKTEEMVMSKYMEHHERQVNGWRLASESEAFRRILELARPDLSIQRLHKTLLIEGEYGFIFLCSDFYFSHDVQNRRLLTMVPGSPAIVLPTKTRFRMSDLIWNVVSYQVFLLARRICQFTKAKWRFDCLAQLEKRREGAKQLNVFETNLLDNVTIDLDPTRFSYLVGYPVGCLDVTHDDYFHVGIDMFGETIVLRLDEGSEFDIALPEVYKGMEKIYSHRSFTDMFDVFIGGDHEVPTGVDAVQRLGDGIHNRTYLKRFGGKVVYNLGFVPQNKEFNKLWKTPYKKTDLPDELLSVLKNRLEYGEQLSYEIAQRALLMWKGNRVTITLAEAQHQLFDFWMKGKFENCKRFSLLRAKIHQGWYLMFEAGKLHVVKSDRAITNGINGSISARFPGFSATGGASASVTAREFTQNSPVVNLLDAVVKVSGVDPEFDPACKSWYKPTKHGMEQILGGLAIVCALLDGHVEPQGMFYGAVGKEELKKPKTKQEVDFNIPISLGLAYSTLSRTTEPDVVPPSNPYFSEKMVFRCAESAVSLVDDLNYELPLILGGDDQDEELIKALKDYVGYDDNSVTDQERVSEDEDETLSDNPKNNNSPSARTVSVRRILRRIFRPRGKRRLENVTVNSDGAL